jgi:hypothetical protein
MTKKLEQCPFCGAKPEYNGFIYITPHKVKCYFDEFTTIDPISQPKYIKKWNTRAYFSPVKGMEVSVEDIIRTLSKVFHGHEDFCDAMPEQMKMEDSYDLRKAAEAIHSKLSAQPGRGTGSRS